MTGQIFLEAAEISTLETAGTVLVPIVRTGDSSGRVTIQYGTSNQTAIAGQDYVANSGTIVMDAGVTRVLVPITITDDATSEATERFAFSLVNVDSGALTAPRTAQVAILDNENPVVDPPSPPLVSPFDVRLVDDYTGFEQPIAIEFSPVNASLMYVAEKDGIVKAVNTATGSVTTVLNIRTQVNNIQDRGLLDIAIHPDLANNPYLYAFYVADPADVAGKTGNAGPDGGGNRYSHLVRYTLDASSGYQSVVAGSEVILLGGAGRTLADISGAGAIDSTSNLTARDSELLANGTRKQDYMKVDSRSHAGGSIEFGPDGALYVSTGDGASFNATDPRAVSVQDLNSLSGKSLRINPLTGDGFADNPFYVQGQSLDANQSKVYQLGLRNPFSLSFDKQGQLFITETGWNSYEEINSAPPGANFGWPYYEGGDAGINLRTPGYRDLPAAAAFYSGVANGTIKITPAYRGFSHTSSDPGFQVQAIVGADDVITGNIYPDDLVNDYVFADYSQGEIFAVDVNDRQSIKFLASIPGIGPIHYKLGPDGYLYYVNIATGAIGHLEIAQAGVLAPVQPGTLRAEYYNIALTDLDQFDFNRLANAVEDVTAIQKPSSTGAVYPGGPSDNVAAKYTGALSIEQAGYYTFYLRSDDGSKLYVDGRLVIDNDGVHASTEKSITLSLASGSHVIKVLYFDGTGGAQLELDWSGPKFARQDLRFDGINTTLVTNDIANLTQYLNGSPAGSETFFIDGRSADYGWNPTADNSGHVVYGPTGFDLLYDSFDFIRFNDRTVSLGGQGTEVRDIANVTQYLTGTGSNDVFVINGRASSYQFNALSDGTGHVVYGATGFDLLYGFEKIKFTDTIIDLSGQTGRTVDNIVGETQYLQGSNAADTFVINGVSTDYVWGATQDGQDHIVYRGNDFDLLYNWEFIRFNDRTVELV